MISREELLTLLSDLESDRVERTISTNKTDKFCQAICAFANDMPNHKKPGYLLIGVEDNGSLNGQTITDDLLQKLGGLRSDGNILPQPHINIEKYVFDKGEVAVVEVFPSHLPPIRYKGQIWIRVGPRKAIANEQEERTLVEKRISAAKSFDSQPCMDSTLSDLSLMLFESYKRQAIDPEVIAENHREQSLQLASLRFFNPELECPTNSGVILFGKSPRFFLPGNYIQYLQMPNNDLTDLPIDQAEISGDLYIIIREMEIRIKNLIKTDIQQISGMEEKVYYSYPEYALRELFMNAVMHRNYESNTPIRFYVYRDFIEIMNPGGLYGEATRTNFPNRNSYRNPVIAEALKLMGFVNRFGYGVKRAQDLLNKNGNLPAEFEFEENSFYTKIHRRQA